LQDLLTEKVCLRSWLTRNVILRLSQWVQSETMLPNLAELNRSQWSSPRELGLWQWQRLQETLQSAYANIPFYRRRLDAHRIDPWKMEPEDFQRVPTLSKQDVRDNFEQLLWRAGGDRLRVSDTSGSTGAPLRFAHGRTYSSRHEAGQWRARGWFGVSPGDAVLAIWGRPVNNPKDKKILEFKSYLNHYLHVSAFDIDRPFLIELARRLRSFRPRLVYGYPSGIYELAKVAQEENLRLDHLGIRMVGCTAESLYEFQRELMCSVFGAPVSNIYGCGEFGSFAHQCPRGMMHIASENVVVEFLNDGKAAEPGEPGEVTVTSLQNPGMPLIRYVVGDVGIPLAESCPCGRSLPTMDIKAGKIGQMVRTDSGKIFSTELFDYINRNLMLRELKGVEQFLVVQNKLDSFTVEFIQGPSQVEESKSAFEAGMREVLGGHVQVAFQPVDAIVRHSGGKMGYFESRIKDG